MTKDHAWMAAVLEDVRSFCEQNNLEKSEAAIRNAMEVSQAETGAGDVAVAPVRKM